MIVISSREFRENQKKYFDLAQIQRVIIKRKNQFFELVSHGNIIPEEKAPKTSEEIEQEKEESQTSTDK